jgi:hypothetical protein
MSLENLLLFQVTEQAPVDIPFIPEPVGFSLEVTNELVNRSFGCFYELLIHCHMTSPIDCDNLPWDLWIPAHYGSLNSRKTTIYIVVTRTRSPVNSCGGCKSACFRFFRLL